MGRQTLDQAAFARLHSITKPVQVLAAVHAKSCRLGPRHWLRGGRLRLGKSRRSNKHKDYSDERPTRDTVRHQNSSVASASRAERNRDVKGKSNFPIIWTVFRQPGSSKEWLSLSPPQNGPQRPRGLQLVIFAQDIGYRFVKIRRRLPRVEEVFERAQVLL